MVEKNDTLGARKCFFFLNLNLSYRRYKNVHFDIICADIVYPPGEKLPYLLIFARIKNFLDVYNVEHPGQTQST